MLLIIAGGNAEGDQAAAEPASNEAEHETEDPAQGALLLVHVCHTGLIAVLARDSNRMVWPAVDWVETCFYHNHLSLRLYHHDSLPWSLHHHRLSHRSVLRLAHLSRGVHWLRLGEHWLRLGHSLSDTDSINLL